MDEARHRVMIERSVYPYHIALLPPIEECRWAITLHNFVRFGLKQNLSWSASSFNLGISPLFLAAELIIPRHG